MTYSFAVENTMGKLTKWLRILGFDTIFDSGARGVEFFRSASPDRVLLTRTGRVEKELRSDRLIFVQADDCRQQLLEVIRCLEIQPEDIRPFTRCIECNDIIESVEKPSVRDMVPDYVYGSHEHFRRCPRCGKVFWPGSHADRAMDRIRRLFDAAAHGSDEQNSPA